MTTNIIPQFEDIFQTVKTIPLMEIIERYSPNPLITRAGKPWLTCPFHNNDKNPSLSLKGQRWHCFGCQAGGDGADFVAKLYGLTSLEAAKVIASDFGLAVEQDKPLPPERRAEIQARQEQRQHEKAWRQSVDELFKMACQTRDDLLQVITPESVDGETLKFLIELESLMNVVISNDDDKIFSLLNGGEVYDIA